MAMNRSPSGARLYRPSGADTWSGDPAALHRVQEGRLIPVPRWQRRGCMDDIQMYAPGACQRQAESAKKRRMNADDPLNFSGEDMERSSWIAAVQRKVDPQKDPYSAAVEGRFRQLVADRAAADRVYDQLPQAYGGKVNQSDTAREILPEYQTREQRMAHTIGTGVASAYAKDRLERELADPRGRTRLVLMAGGPGAGKSTFPQSGGVRTGGPDFRRDPCARRSGRGRMIDLALEHGWEVVVLRAAAHGGCLSRAWCSARMGTGAGSRFATSSTLTPMHRGRGGTGPCFCE